MDEKSTGPLVSVQPRSVPYGQLQPPSLHFCCRTDAILGLLLPHVLNEFPLLIHLAVAAPLKRVRLEADGESAQLLPIPQRRNEQNDAEKAVRET